MKYNFIVYNPGYAGNFLARVFSLGPETCPQLPIKMLESYDTIPQLSLEQRLELYSFKNVKAEFSNWQSFHRSWIDFLSHSEIKKKKNSLHEVCFFSMHFPEYKNQLSNIKTLNGTIVGVDLDLEVYNSWVDKSQKDLLFKYRLDEKTNYNKWISKFNDKISLTNMLSSKDKFVSEYQATCDFFQIDQHVDPAIDLYNDWREVRVKDYVVEVLR